MTRPDLTLVQLSDTHILPDGVLMHDVVDTTAHLSAALAAIESSGLSAAAFLLTGDLTDNGDPAAYRRLGGLVEPVAARVGAEVVYVMGNHDERAAFRTELLGAEASTVEHDTVVTVGGLRVVVLDTSVPGRHDGHLSGEQLDWLAGQLAEPAALGTVLVCHHPPLRSPVPTVDLLRLRDAEKLAAVLAGSDVRLVVTGHAHHAGAGALAGVPVWVGPALAYGVAPVPPAGRLRAAADSAFTRIDVFGDQIVATLVPVSSAATVYDVSETERMRYVREVVSTW